MAFSVFSFQLKEYQQDKIGGSIIFYRIWHGIFTVLSCDILLFQLVKLDYSLENSLSQRH
jgi:hypothetical protein